jgi:hypothetical protein
MSEIIRKFYLLAVQNLNVRIVNNHSQWYNYTINLPTPQQAVYTIILLDYYVKTEGFVGYFTSSFGMFALQTLTNLEQIKSVEHVNVLRDVLDSLNKEPIGDLSHFDMQYQSIVNENLDDLLVSFLEEKS